MMTTEKEHIRVLFKKAIGTIDSKQEFSITEKFHHTIHGDLEFLIEVTKSDIPEAHEGDLFLRFGVAIGKDDWCKTSLCLGNKSHIISKLSQYYKNLTPLLHELPQIYRNLLEK